MKLLLAALLLLPAAAAPRGDAVQDPAPTPTDPGAPAVAAATVEGLVRALYQAVSFDPGAEPDYDMIRALCLEGCVVVQPPRGPGGPKAISIEDFITRFKTDYERAQMGVTGFHERVVNHQAQVWQQTAAVAVVFEARLDPESEEPIGSGLDRLHLVRNDGRWWIASIVTEYAHPGKPVPAAFLPASQETEGESGLRRR